METLKGRTQCTRLPLYAGFGRGECRLALPPFMKRLLPCLEPETYRSWANALAIAQIIKEKTTYVHVRPLFPEPRHHHPLHDLVEVIDGSIRNHVNHDVIVADRLNRWDLVLLAVANDLFFFIREKDGEKGGEKDGRE
ncbi:hypothetical protein DVH24_037029 [Malus domestica]|uniref:Uncharacterized protein n=1 Tax=Malus domestica TaxID=3750 RepID=A0A498HIB0_MALDO|nr:hypothetical protein DVH24_037029 [Malus domestica]